MHTPDSVPDLTPIRLERELSWPLIVEQLRALSANFKAPVYLVGGSVRDAYLGRPIHDLDLVTGGDALAIARKIGNKLKGAYYPLDEERGIGRAIVTFDGERYEIDVSRFRARDKFVSSLGEDLAARDFTANAMAVQLDGDLSAVYDPMSGLVDVKARRLRRCSPDAIAADPVRALRAVRQSVALKLLIERDTREDVRVARLSTLSPERVRDELFKTLDGIQPHAALRALDSLGLLAQIIPEIIPLHGLTQSLPHIYDVWEHTLKVIEALERIIAIVSPERTEATAADGKLAMVVFKLDRHRAHLQAHLSHPWPNGRTARALLIFAALLHDSGKAATRTVDEAQERAIRFIGHDEVGAQLAHERAMAFRLSSVEVERVTAIVRAHMRINNLYRMAEREGALTARPIFRFWKALGPAGVDVCLLALADWLGTGNAQWEMEGWLRYLDVVDTLLDAYFNRRAELVAPPPLVDGNGLMQALDLAPGPVIGALLERLTEAQVVGDIHTSDGAIALARQLYREYGLEGLTRGRLA